MGARGANIATAYPRHLALGAFVAGLLLGTAALELAIVVAVVAAAAALPRAALAAGLGSAVLAGGVVAHERAVALERSALSPGRFAGDATLLEPPRRGAAVVRVRGEKAQARAPRRVRWPAVSTGDVVRVRGRLVAPDDRAQAKRAHAVLLVTDVSATGRRRGGWLGAVDSVRRRAERALAAGLPPPEAALFRGMVLGQDEALSEPTREDFRRAGLAHILAASGQNVALLAALALPLLALAGVGSRARLLVLGGLVAVYVPLAGGGPPIVRAGIMGAATIAAGLSGQAASRWYALLLAAAVTLTLDPHAVADVAWQLSFCAVMAIMLLAPRLRRTLADRDVPEWLAEATAMTAAATLGTAPLLWAHFGSVSLAGLIANVAAAPVIAAVMWLGMIAAAAGPALAAPFTALALPGLGYLEWLAHAAAGWPGASLEGPAAASGLAAVAAAVFVALARTRRRRIAALVLAVVAPLCVAALARGPAVLEPRGLTVSFLDVGQGDATLIQHGGRSLLVDTGPPGSRLLDHLERAGAERLDALVITHQSADHDGGASAVLESLPVNVLLDGGRGYYTPERRALLDAARRRGVPALVPVAGQRLRLGAIEIGVLWPAPRGAGAPLPAEPNGRALVLHLRAEGASVLLPADAESEVTLPLDLPAADVLKVAHHGSADPALPALLERVRPRLAVVPVGAENSYGHPAPTTLAALRSAVPRVLRTDRDGTVRVEIERGRIRVMRGL